MTGTPRGFRDLYAEQADKYNRFATVALNVAKRYGCQTLITPCVEYTDLFTKNMQDSSVVVDNEIFTLTKPGLCLRPEITAPIVRFVTEHNLHKARLTYFGPCFRGERPQAGRYRQFYQFGIEMIGGSNDVYDCISALVDVLKYIPKQFTIAINNIGDAQTRAAFEVELRKYLQDKPLSSVSTTRLAENRLLRILDSKEPEDQAILIHAPKLYSFLNTQQVSILNTVQSIIEDAGYKVKIDHNLVRGLDYYTGIVFEVLNEQGLAVGGGGEYNNLLFLQNNYIHCIGFAIGVDRIVEGSSDHKDMRILLASDNAQLLVKYAKKLRTAHHNVVTTLGTKKLDTLTKYYNTDATIVLYEHDVFAGERMYYEQFERNNFEVVTTMYHNRLHDVQMN
jgi:histidyl-tRNA synthetase